MIISGVNAIYYGGSVMENTDKDNKPTGEFKSYLSFVQVNKDKNKMEQVLVTYNGDITKNGKDGTIKGAGLVAGQEYTLELDMQLSNEKDKDGKSKASRHILLAYAPKK